MKKMVFIVALIALAMLVIAPASADVWHNDKYFGTDEEYNAYVNGAEVVHDSKTDTDSKYRAIDITKDADVWTGENTCILRGALRCGHNLMTPELTIWNNVNPNETQIIPVLSDGSYQFDDLAHGEYTLYTPTGNGMQPEYSQVVCSGSGIVYPVDPILGQAVTTRGDPKDATIDASFRRGDVEVRWWKLVKTGQHPYNPPCYQITVIDEPEWDETVLVTPAYDEYVHVGHNHGDYDRFMGHYIYVGHNHGDYDLVHHDAVYEIVHHPAITHEETVCPATVMIPEYGIEFFLEIDGANVEVSNPNHDQVNVDFAFDINYWIDRRPWDFNAMPYQIEPRSETYTGTLTGVYYGTHTYHGVLYPDIDNAVSVFDFERGMQYIPYISNEQVTATEWTH